MSYQVLIFSTLYIYIMCICNVAHSTFAPFARFSPYGRKSSQHPPPPNRTSTSMCQRKGKNVRFSVKAGNRVLSILVACPTSSSTSSKATPSTWTTLDDVHRAAAYTRSARSRFRSPPFGFLYSALSCAELRCRLSPCSSLGPYAATSHVSYSTPLCVPFRKGTLLPRHPCRCSLLWCPPQPLMLPFRPEEHPLGPLGPAHPSWCRVRSSRRLCLLWPSSPRRHLPSPRSYVATAAEPPRSPEPVWRIPLGPSLCGLRSQPLRRPSLPTNLLWHCARTRHHHLPHARLWKTSSDSHSR